MIRNAKWQSLLSCAGSFWFSNLFRGHFAFFASWVINLGRCPFLAEKAWAIARKRLFSIKILQAGSDFKLFIFCMALAWEDRCAPRQHFLEDRVASCLDVQLAKVLVKLLGVLLAASLELRQDAWLYKEEFWSLVEDRCNFDVCITIVVLNCLNVLLFTLNDHGFLTGVSASIYL